MARPLYDPFWPYRESVTARGRGALAGILAAAFGLGVGELIAGLARSAAAPVVPVGQVVIDHVPIDVKEWAIRTFGSSDKAVLVLGSLVVIIVIGALAGMLAGSGHLASALGLTAVVGFVGCWAVAVRPAPSLVKMLPAIFGTLAAAGALWLLTEGVERWTAARTAAAPADSMDIGEGGATIVAGTSPSATIVATPVAVAPSTAPSTRMGVDRRAFLVAGVGVGALAALTAKSGSALRRRFEVTGERAQLTLPAPVSAAPAIGPKEEVGVAGVDPWLTSADDFYRIDTAIVVPQVRREEWKLKIHGMVDHEIELDYDQLLARGPIERYVTLSCVSNEVGGGLIGNARWLGVPLAPLLREAGVHKGAEQLVSRSIDGFTCGSPVAAILDGRDAMLAIAMNGQPLPAKHGYPVRMVIPGLYGYVSATKWVVDMELTTWDAYDAYWVDLGWAQQAPVKVQSRIDAVGKPGADGIVPVGGVAWAVHRGISKVELRIDEGEWVPATLLGDVPSNDTWRQWRYDWPAAAGDHELQVRATTGDGEVQTGDVAPPAPDGAQGWHTVTVRVSA
jgi:DMSO/TMAO reductase YedYZ molybdopterin-dependent catalytic subunit